MIAQGLFKWASSDNSFVVQLPLRTLQDLDRYFARHNETETGGILVGHYSSDSGTANVTKVYPPPRDSVFGRWWFVRGKLGLTAILMRLWNSKNRHYYIGEWHYHPSNNVSPSEIDKEQMISIARSSDYQCKIPILLIIGNKGTVCASPISITVFSADANPVPLLLQPTT